jgi:diphthamide biosynthesis protein 3
MADEEVALYDEIEIEDCVYDETLEIYHHPCPCGDRFEISVADMRDGEDIARCPSCSLMIRIIFDPVSVFYLRVNHSRENETDNTCSRTYPQRRRSKQRALPSPHNIVSKHS